MTVESRHFPPLPKAFYLRTDVVQIARELLGKVLVTDIDGQRTAGIITETEAYRAPDDKACHAYGNRRTARTEVLFQEGGRAYIYLCYGIHHLFNVVTAPEGCAHAVLVRAVEPLEGLDIMYERRGISPQKGTPPKRLTTGPGALAQALGLHTGLNGHRLLQADAVLWIGEGQLNLPEWEISTGKRIGVAYAGECADWPWRFWWNRSVFYK